MMTFQIVKVVKPAVCGAIVESELKCFDTFDHATKVLYRLAHIQHWEHKPGIILDKFQDMDLNFYYVKEKTT